MTQSQGQAVPNVTFQSTAVSAPVISHSSALTQVSTVLGGIVLLILLIAWLAKKFGFAPQGKQNRMLKVLSSCPVGQRERVVIVEVENTWLVLGVTSQQITHLHTLPANVAGEMLDSDKSVSTDFRQLLNNIIKRPEKSE
nr:flagellar biosynthetic protein FliO [Brenneria ulupoensis]